MSEIKTKKKNINHELTEKIEELLSKGENILDIVHDLLEFENVDVYDIIECIPDNIVQKIKKALAEKNYKIAAKDFPELEVQTLDDTAF